ncbi:uncharacterized protein [Drosophila kikkawai]|uniref:Uncharacterized protein n=1 Tax=Drosophila kikkawai TaxID=30033 RepID=A0A6P4JIF9_DROKI|nr:uncharacterized protein LOC108083330 [Drosophila kikkawai]
MRLPVFPCPPTWILSVIRLEAPVQKPASKRAATSVAQMSARIGNGISSSSHAAPLIVALTLLTLMTLAWAQGGGPDYEMDYSNEYDDVRPHLVYPDVPRLDKRIGDAAREFGQNITQAWQSMVDSFKNYFEELKNLFAGSPDPNAANEVFSAH